MQCYPEVSINLELETVSILLTGYNVYVSAAHVNAKGQCTTLDRFHWTTVPVEHYILNISLKPIFPSPCYIAARAKPDCSCT